MTCPNCHAPSVALYGIPTGRFAHMPDPMAPKYCWDCFSDVYEDEEFEPESKPIPIKASSLFASARTVTPLVPLSPSSPTSTEGTDLNNCAVSKKR